ncbi:MAG: hypothetical protein ACYCTL_06780 [Acidimicrobiales bacterium]
MDDFDTRLRRALGSSQREAGTTDPDSRKMILLGIARRNERRRRVAAGAMVAAVLLAAFGAFAVVSHAGIDRPVREASAPEHRLPVAGAASQERRPAQVAKAPTRGVALCVAVRVGTVSHPGCAGEVQPAYGTARNFAAMAAPESSGSRVPAGNQVPLVVRVGQELGISFPRTSLAPGHLGFGWSLPALSPPGSALHEVSAEPERATGRSEMKFVASGQGMARIVASERPTCVVARGLDVPCGPAVKRWVLVVKIVKD